MRVKCHSVRRIPENPPPLEFSAMNRANALPLWSRLSIYVIGQSFMYTQALSISVEHFVLDFADFGEIKCQAKKSKITNI